MSTRKHKPAFETSPDTVPRLEYQQSQKLVQCYTENERGERRLRLVEMENFRLWEYMMTNKHGLKILEPEPCLWIHQGDFDHKQHLYSHAPSVEAVNRVVLSIYDEVYGFSHFVNRFVSAADTEQLIDILSNHMQRRVDQGDECEFIVVEGYCVQRWQHEGLPPLMVGLST
ncbi:MAG: hypothetical protein ACPGF7_00780 [Pontibacterium sp.]